MTGNPVGTTGDNLLAQPKPNLATPVGQFLSLVFAGCEGFIEIRPIGPNGPSSIRFFKDAAQAEAYGHSLDGKANIYYGVGTRKRESGTKADVQMLPGVWADCDTPESVAALEAFPQRPTFVVETSPGKRQAIWQFDQPLLLESDTIIATVETVLRGLARVLGTDPSCAEAARILRLPGTTNIKKGTGGACRLLSSDGPRYELDDFSDLAGAEDSRDGISQGRRRFDTARALAGVPEHQRDIATWKLACKLRNADVPQEIAERLVLEAAANCNPKFDLDVAREKVTRAYRRYAAGPARDEEDVAAERSVRVWPHSPALAAFYGLAGDIVRAIDPHTESDPIAILLQIMVGFGNLIGRTTYFKVEADRHYLNIFTVLVGGTSKGRKGTSLAHVRSLFTSIDESWATERLQSGLSSGEGIIWAVRDPIEKQIPVKERGRIVDYQTEIVDHGIADKRLLVQESEFASVLRVIERDGNTLSALIRQAWDTGALRTMTKNSPARATGAHISIIGHITKEELVRYLDRTEAGNGFANRILWAVVRRSKLLPEGGQISTVDFAPLLNRLQSAVRLARQTGEILRDADAAALWREVYARLSEGRPGLLGAVTSRAEAQVVRLACIYALLDLSAVVRVDHLHAALAVWDYCEASCQFIFGDALGDPLADDLLGLLRASPDGLTRTEIRDHFQRNKRPGQVGRALGLLAEHGLITVRKEKTNGRPAERWVAVRPGDHDRDAPQGGDANGGAA